MGSVGRTRNEKRAEREREREREGKEDGGREGKFIVPMKLRHTAK
jgi:hypothetical protein